MTSPQFPSDETASRAGRLEQSLREDRKFFLGLARSQLQDPQSAEDVVQEMALAAWRDIDRFEGRSSIRTWLVGVLRFKILDALRDRQRHAGWRVFDAEQEMAQMSEEGLFDAEGYWSDAPLAWERPPGRPDERMQQQQLMRLLQGCLNRLPEKSSQIFLMREYLGFDTIEISHRTGLLTGNIRVILMRSRLALRTCLELQMVNNPPGEDGHGAI